jgi:Raf kinase inhibitor-like YbhB/YbcL family protein
MSAATFARRALAAAALLAAVALDALAQVPPGAPPGQRGGGRGGRGGGGGRGRAIQVMALTSRAFEDGGRIPVKFAQPGGDVSPPLAWTGVPDSIASFALVVHDVDAASEGRGGASAPASFDDLLQWMVWNIPGSVHSLAEGVPLGAQLADGMRQISATGPYYRGPAAPSSGPPHHYLFELYALDTLLDVPPVGAAPAATRAAVITAMLGHVRGKAVLVGTFRRAAP